MQSKHNLIHFLQPHSKIILILFVFLFSLSIRLYDLNATGGLWDEDIYFSSGYNFVYNFKNRDFNPDKWGWNSEHPPLAKYIWGVGAYVSYHLPDSPAYRPKLNYGIPRILSAVLGALTVVIVMLIGWNFFSPLVGVLSATILSLQPQFIAYNKALDLSTPLIFFSTCSFYFFLKFLNKKDAKTLIICFLLLGLAGSTRFDGFLLIPIYFFILLLKDIMDKSGFRLTRKAILAAPIPLLVLFIIWPYLWRDPFLRLIQSLNVQAQHLGEKDPLKMLTMFGVTQPVLLLSLFLLGFSVIIKPVKLKFNQAVVILWTTLFFILSIIFGLGGSNVRYFVPVYIPVSLIAGFGFEIILSKINSFTLKLAIVFLLLVYLIYSNWRIHPYYLNYYNEFVANAAESSKLGFPTGTRNEGIKEVIDYLNKNALNGALIKIIALQDESPVLRFDLIRVSPYGDSADLSGKVYSDLDGKKVLADYWVFNPYYFANDFKISKNPNYKLIYEAKVLGKFPLASVYQLVK